jgi:hypothetical protein
MNNDQEDVNAARLGSGDQEDPGAGGQPARDLMSPQLAALGEVVLGS